MKDRINILLLCILTSSITAFGMNTPRKKIFLDPAIYQQIQLACSEQYQALKAKTPAPALTQPMEPVAVKMEIHILPEVINPEITTEPETESTIEALVPQETNIQKNNTLLNPVIIAATMLPKKPKKKQLQKPKPGKNRKTKPVEKIKPAPKPKPVPVNPNAEKEAQSDAFWSALFANDTNLVSQMIAAHPKAIALLETPHRTGSTTPLISAITEGLEPMCHTLLTAGANPNTTSTIKLPEKQGWLKTTPLLLAIKAGKPNLVRILLDHKADPNIAAIRIPSRFLDHALCVAAKPLTAKAKTPAGKAQQREMVKLLLLSGATEYCGQMAFFDTKQGGGYYIKLHDPIYQDLLPRLIEGTTKVSCKLGKITLHGSPVFKNEQEEEGSSTEELVLTDSPEEESCASVDSETEK